jgi:hypothetical protein
VDFCSSEAWWWLCQAGSGSILVTERPAEGYRRVRGGRRPRRDGLSGGQVVRCRVIRERRWALGRVPRTESGVSAWFGLLAAGLGSAVAQAPATPLPRTSTLLNVRLPEVSWPPDDVSTPPVWSHRQRCR